MIDFHFLFFFNKIKKKNKKFYHKKIYLHFKLDLIKNLKKQIF